MNQNKKINFQTLSLDDTQKDKIGDLAKRNKFIIRDTLFLYSKNNIELAKNFCDSYRFLESLYNVLNEGEIKNKINNYIKSIKELYDEIYKLIKDYDSTTITYSQYIKQKQISKILNDNKKIIDYSLDVSFDLGRKVKKINPSETQGYY